MYSKILNLINKNTYFNIKLNTFLFNPEAESSKIIDLLNYEIIKSYDFNCQFYLKTALDEIIINSNAKMILNDDFLYEKHTVRKSFCDNYFRFNYLDYNDWQEKECFIIKSKEIALPDSEKKKIDIDCKIFNVYKISNDLIVFGYIDKTLIFEKHLIPVNTIKLCSNTQWTREINIANQFVGMNKDNLSFQKLIGHDNDYLYFSLNDGRIYEINVLSGDYSIIHNEYSQIRYGQYLDTETKEIFGSENYILEVLDLRTRQKTTHNFKPLFEQHGMTGTKNLLYVDKKHLYYGDNGKGGILILERGTFQPVWYEKTKPVLDLQIDGDHMAVYHMGNQLTLYKRTDTMTEQEKNMALQLAEGQAIVSHQPKKIIRPGFKIEQLAPHQRNGVDMPTEVYERELDGFYHEGHIIDLIEGMADLTHGILKMDFIQVKPFEKSEEPKNKCQTSLVIKGKEYKLNFDMFYAGLENFDFLSSMNRLLKETGYEGGNVFCDVTEDAHFIRFVFVAPEKYAEMDKAGIVIHPFDAANY